MATKLGTSTTLQHAAIPKDPEDPNPPARSLRKKMVNDLKSSKLMRKVLATNASKKLKKIG